MMGIALNKSTKPQYEKMYNTRTGSLQHPIIPAFIFPTKFIAYNTFYLMALLQ